MICTENKADKRHEKAGDFLSTWMKTVLSLDMKQ